MNLSATDALHVPVDKFFLESDDTLIEPVPPPEAADVMPWLDVARQAAQNAAPGEARMLLQEALQRFPNVPEVRQDLAQLAESLQDWPEAESHWRGFAALSPADWWVALRIAHARSQQYGLAEAEAVLREAMDRFPDQVWIVVEYARVAEARRDPGEAEKRWSTATDRFPKCWEAWVGLVSVVQEAGALAEAEVLLRNAQVCCPEAVRLFVDYARLAEARQAWPEAAARWSVVTERFPEVWEGIAGEARASREQGHPEAAHTFLIRALEHFPTMVEPVDELARLAEALGNWTAAERWWRISVALDPAPMHGWIGLITALRIQGRDQEVDAILLPQPEVFGRVMAFLIDHAQVSERSQAWPEALKSWETVRFCFPELPDGYRGGAHVLRRTGAPEAARTMLTDAAERLPEDLGVLNDLVRMAERRDDWVDVERHSRTLVNLDGDDWRAYIALARALLQQQKPSEASDVLVVAIERFSTISDALADLAEQIWWSGGTLPSGQFPTLAGLVECRASEEEPSYRILTAHALLARENCNWPQYRGRLLKAIEIAPPGDRLLQILMAEADELALAHDTYPTADTHAVAKSRTVFVPHNDISDFDLLSLFESLGGGRGSLPGGGLTGGCEFGLVQRHCGAEPLGLLRWASIEPHDLGRALASKFAGFGDADTTELLAIRNSDWQVVETRYNMQMDHTHLDRSKIDRNKAKDMVCKRFGFLKNKLVNDLTVGEKIFVYRLADASVSLDDIKGLAAAVNRYGKNTLLWVTKTQEIAGELVFDQLDEGLMVAKIRSDPESSMNVGAWLEVCRSAYAAVCHTRNGCYTGAASAAAATGPE